LACSHVFHYHCIVSNIQAKWAGVAITFGFLECPLCKAQISHPALAALLKPFLELQADVKRKALDRFEHMKLKDAPELADKNGAYYQNPLKYAMARFCYYPCFKCKKPYFGGLKECNAEQRAAGKDDKLDDLICGSCAAQGAGANSTCAKHGTDYIEYKCKFCCNVAAWYCWGSTHFCEDCHKKAAEVAKIPKDKLPKCTCKGNHPPNGEEHCLGCTFCRFNEQF
jgi:E3 ubiquitin-protein ligase MYCBP2